MAKQTDNKPAKEKPAQQAGGKPAQGAQGKRGDGKRGESSAPAIESGRPKSGGAHARLRAEQDRRDTNAACNDCNVERAARAVESVAERSNEIEPAARL